jgi:hypothetical protein
MKIKGNDFNDLRRDLRELHNHYPSSGIISETAVNHDWLSHGDTGDYKPSYSHKEIDDFISDWDGSEGLSVLPIKANLVIEAYKFDWYMCEARYNDSAKKESLCWGGGEEWYGAGHHAYAWVIWDLWAGICYPGALWFLPLPNTAIQLDSAYIMLQLFYNDRLTLNCRGLCQPIPQPLIVEKGFRGDGLGYIKVAMAGPRMNHDAYDRGCKREIAIYNEKGEIIDHKWTTEPPTIRTLGLNVFILGSRK